MQYNITFLYGDGTETVLATVPFDLNSENTCLFRAYTIAEFLARQIFGGDLVIREISGQLFPLYFADKETGNTVSIK